MKTPVAFVALMMVGRLCSAAEEFAPDREVVFKTIGELELKLHVFEPEGHQATDKTSAIVFFFGGGWTGGEPEQFFQQARRLADQGMVAMSAEYRVQSRNRTTPFESVKDAKSAVRWIRQHATDLGIHPDRIVAAGGSAGGHVAACTGVIDGGDEQGENLAISSIPNAMILFNPVLDTTAKGFGLKRVGEARQTEISPCHHVKPGIAPTLLFHGTADTTVPFENAQRFTRLMQEAGNVCELKATNGAVHGFFNSKFFRPNLKDTSIYDETMRQSVAFLKTIGYLDASADTGRPNIILIYTDDQGFGDVSAINPESKFQTPHLDRLANEGIAFTHAHSPDSVCTPSRYGLLTGRYAWRTHLKRGVFGAERDCLIEDGRMTLASLLGQSGYHTAIVGKWHLGMDFPGASADRDWSQPIRDMPLDKGFDYFFGVPASLNFGVLAWFEGRHAKVPPTLYTRKKANARHSDYRIMPPYESGETDKTSRQRGLEVAPDFIDNQCLTRFTDKAIEWMQGKTNDAKSGKPFFLYLPYTSPHYPVCPLPEFHGEGKAGAYGEFVIETDHHVGRVLRFLQDTGLDENTLIIFTSDNGPENSWSKRIKDFQHDSRGGFREGKRSVYEGGHRVPLLVRWPAGVKQPGRRWDKPIGQTDLLATIAELVGSKLPDDAGEDSQSFASILKNPNADHQRLPLITHGNGNKSFRYAITDGDWKLVLRDKNAPDELYNLSTDSAETQNLASTRPEIVQKLTKKINRIIARGRTTPGPAQANDTDYWEDLHWMTKAEYVSSRMAVEKE